MNDTQLVRAYQDGAAEAFRELIERYRAEMYHFLLRFVNDRAAAEDLFQETFLQLHISIDSYDPARPLKPWLYTIGANKARDWLRRNSRGRMTQGPSLEDAEDGVAGVIDLLQADLPAPAETAANRETAEAVQRVVAGLPDHLREILVLAYFQQLPYKDIARMLDIPLGTVKSRLHAAVGTFAQAWMQAYGGSGRAAQASEEREEPDPERPSRPRPTDT